MSQHIAIVEDELSIRENYADAFKQQGYQVSMYAGRDEAINAFDVRLPDLALLDIGLEDDAEGRATGGGPVWLRDPSGDMRVRIGVPESEMD